MPVESNNNQSDSNNTKENPLFDALRREFVEKKDRGNNKKKSDSVAIRSDIADPTFCFVFIVLRPSRLGGNEKEKMIFIAARPSR